MVPALVGLTLIALVGESVGTRNIAAFGMGIFLWFFVDTLEGSSDLVVGEGLGGGAPQAAILVLFVVGALIFFWVEGPALTVPEGRVPFLPVILAAVALGLHGLGEGFAFGSIASQTSSSSLLAAFGGTSQGVAYTLHKVLEPMMVGALLVAYVKGSPGPARSQTRDLVLLALAFVVPSIVGGAVGYFYAADTTYFYALGAGASVYVGLRLSGQVFSDSFGGRRGSLRPCLALLAGFILIYLAALLHS